jgi:hypothetical protein
VIELSVLGCSVGFACADREAERLILANWGALLAPRPARALDLGYEVSPGPPWELRRNGAALAVDGDLLYCLEQDLVVELQKLRSDLFFLHAAVLERRGRALLLVAESGGGKSTTAWALLHHGFRYVSDELAPLRLASGEVHAYPHALCLKTPPPGPYPLPPGAVRTDRAIYVPAGLPPVEVAQSACPVDTIVFLQRKAAGPALRALSAAEAGARVYQAALNPLAHEDDGLGPALEIARRGRCFELRAGELAATSALVASCILR